MLSGTPESMTCFTSCGYWGRAAMAGTRTELHAGTPQGLPIPSREGFRCRGLSRHSRSAARGLLRTWLTIASLRFIFCGSICCWRWRLRTILMQVLMVSLGGAMRFAVALFLFSLLLQECITHSSRCCALSIKPVVCNNALRIHYKLTCYSLPWVHAPAL
jgi:hypothetical protein